MKYNYIKKNTKPNRPILNAISYLTILIGTLFVFWSFYPVISFEIYSRFFISNRPQSGIALAYGSENVPSVGRVFANIIDPRVESTDLTDYSKAATWFPTADSNWKESGSEKETQLTLDNVDEYALSIPKLKIENAKIIINGSDLSKGLIHYLAKSLPGELGNVAVFGHSTLPQLYNPKNYKTIFTYLPTLDRGDMINVNLQGNTLNYEVIDMFVVNPDQISILDQQYDSSYLTLVTCVPPGTYWKRLVVKAKLKV